MAKRTEMTQGQVLGRIRILLAALAFSLVASSAWAGLLASARDLFDGPHLFGRYAELKEDFQPTSVVWSPDGKYIATTGIHTQNVDIWDVAQRQLTIRAELGVPNSPSFHNLAWSPNGRHLAVCAGWSGLSLRIWDTTTWQVSRDFNNDSGVQSCRSPVFSRDGRQLAVGQETQISIFSTDSWQQVKRWALPRDVGRVLEQIAFAPDGQKLAIAENGYWNHQPEGRIVFWNLVDNQPGPSFVAYKGVRGDVISMTFSPAGQHLATGTLTDVGTNHLSVRVWNLADYQLLGSPLDGTGGKVYALAYTPDGRYLIAGHEEDEGTIHIVDPRTLQIVDTVHASGQVRSIAVSPDSSMFAVTGGDHISIWAIAKEK